MVVSHHERGSGTVLTLALLLLLGAAAFLVLGQGQVLQLKHHLQSAADLSAIAAAQSPGDPCSSAQSIAQANATRLVSCEVDGADYLVRVEADPPSFMARLFAAVDLPIDPIGASSRAGIDPRPWSVAEP